MRANQPPQRNAGSRPSSSDLPVSEIPSSLARVADLNVRRPHADEARSRFFVLDELGAFTVFRKSRRLRSVMKKKERFGFRRSTGDSEISIFPGVKIGTALNRKSASADAARPNQSSQRNAITGPFSVCDRHSSRG